MNKIISIGCSYALDLYKIYGNNQIRYNYSSFSVSAVLEAIRHHKKQYNDNPWVVGITQVGRLVKKLPKDLHYPNYIPASMDTDPEGGYVKIGDERFSTFIENHDVIKTKSDFPLEWWETQFKTHYDKSIEEHLNEYLTSIYDIQTELKGFEYKMFLMSNTLEGYYYSDGILRHLYSKNDKYEVQDLSSGLSVETILPEQWNKIDWSKFCFYETKGNRYGGLDEYTIDNFTKDYFIDYAFRKDSQNMYGMHPNHIVQTSFYENIIRKT